MSWALLLVMLAPAISVVGYEVRGHRHVARLLGEGLDQELGQEKGA
jgi:hypothetical protein